MHNILVVEDGLIIALHIQKLLEINGYKVIEKLKYAEDVEASVQKLKPDLIILDVMLEGEMNGIECATILREFTDIPIIFMSALTDKETVHDISSISNSVKINKPFNEDELIRNIKVALNES